MNFNYIPDDIANVLNHLSVHLKINRVEAAKRILAALPKRRRQNSVVCILTGEDTYSQSGLHPDAMALIHKALIEYDLKDRSVLGNFVWDHDWTTVYVNQPDGKRGYLSNWRVLETFMEVLNLVSWRRYVHEDTPVIWLSDRPEKRYPMEVDGMTCTEAQAMALQSAVTRFKEEIQRAYDTGLRNGSSWLQGMAQGELSIDEINRFETERTRAGENIK